MKKFSTVMIVMLVIVFWILRIIITLSAQTGKDFLGGVQPINNDVEIILLFGTLVCVILIAKRKMIGALIYLAMNAVYYGGDIVQKLNQMSYGQTLSMTDSTELAFSLAGIILGILVLLDMILDQTRKENPKDKKTDWFYKNKDFDRKLDDRADKNNYRTL